MDSGSEALISGQISPIKKPSASRFAMLSDPMNIAVGLLVEGGFGAFNSIMWPTVSTGFPLNPLK
jgi:hypothetical protein